MRTKQLEVLKAELARDILNEQDENLLAKVAAFFTKEKAAAPPCRYSVEEMREKLAKVPNEIAAGRFVAHEEIGRKSMPA
jgi:hypothetical protein